MGTSKHYGERRVDKCPECESVNLIRDYNTGEAVCGSCGYVMPGQMMNKGPEWRAFTQEEETLKSRTGIPSSYSIHDKGHGTVIDRVDRDAFGRKLPDSTRREMYRLRKWQKRTRVYKSADRNLAQAMGELERLRDKVYVSKQVQEEAAVIYRKALDKGLIRGRSIAAIAAAALYAACRYTGTSRTLKTIAKASLVDKKDVGRCYRLLLRELEIKMPVADSISYVSKIAEPLKISGETQGKAIQIIRGFKKKLKTGGKNPQGLAGAALYIACEQNNEKRIQKDIAEIAGVTEVTIRNLYKAIKRTLKIQLND